MRIEKGALPESVSQWIAHSRAKQVRNFSKLVYEYGHTDQNGKCYLCERSLTTDINIDHLRPYSKDEAGRFEWNNLFMCCSRCNTIKGEGYIDLPDPTQHNIAREIRHTVFLDKKKFVFTPVNKIFPGELTLINLLTNIFEPEERQLKSESFRNYVFGKLVEFHNLCELYLIAPTTEHYYDLERALRPDKEFLGFKYWIMQDDEKLKEDFRNILRTIR